MQSCPAHSRSLKVPAACCGGDGDHPQAAEEQHDPPGKAAFIAGNAACSLPRAQGIPHLQEPACAADGSG